MKSQQCITDRQFRVMMFAYSPCLAALVFLFLQHMSVSLRELDGPSGPRAIRGWVQTSPQQCDDPPGL